MRPIFWILGPRRTVEYIYGIPLLSRFLLSYIKLFSKNVSKWWRFLKVTPAFFRSVVYYYFMLVPWWSGCLLKENWPHWLPVECCHSCQVNWLHSFPTVTLVHQLHSIHSTSWKFYRKRDKSFYLKRVISFYQKQVATPNFITNP